MGIGMDGGSVNNNGANLYNIYYTVYIIIYTHPSDVGGVFGPR